MPKTGLTGLHERNNRLVHGRSEPDLRRLARNRAVDHVDLRPTAREVIEQH